MAGKTIKGWHLLANGISHRGTASSVTPPPLMLMTEESNMADEGGKYNIATGKFDAMEFSFTIQDAHPDLESYIGDPASNDFSTHFNAVYTDGSTDRSERYIVKGLWQKSEPGETSSSGMKEITYTISVREITHTVDGREIKHIDLPRMIHRSNGVDLNEQLRRNLAIN